MNDELQGFGDEHIMNLNAADLLDDELRGSGYKRIMNNDWCLNIYN